MFQSPGAIAFHIGEMPIFWYGIILAIAAFVGFYVSSYIYSKYHNNPAEAEKILDIAPILIVCGIIGARLYYCGVSYEYYLTHPIQIFDLRQGGLSIHGMIIGGLVGLWFCVKKYNLNFLKVVDCLVCGTALAQSIGRWGNFFNSEAFGMPTNLPWKLFIPLENRPGSLIRYEYFHPTFLYESILDFLIFIFLVVILQRYGKYQGLTFSLYLILYSVARIGIEYLRLDSAMYIGSMPVAVFVSICLITCSSLFLAGIVMGAKQK